MRNWRAYLTFLRRVRLTYSVAYSIELSRSDFTQPPGPFYRRYALSRADPLENSISAEYREHSFTFKSQNLVFSRISVLYRQLA